MNYKLYIDNTGWITHEILDRKHKFLSLTNNFPLKIKDKYWWAYHNREILKNIIEIKERTFYESIIRWWRFRNIP